MCGVRVNVEVSSQVRLLINSKPTSLVVDAIETKSHKLAFWRRFFSNTMTGPFTQINSSACHQQQQSYVCACVRPNATTKARQAVSEKIIRLLTVERERESKAKPFQQVLYVLYGSLCWWCARNQLWGWWVVQRLSLLVWGLEHSC